ncbi:ABC transporter ATP-binding protein/permease [Acetatifactor muris]|uniref:Putative ABC transporter ATP-binding protein n=1 Tax=Acetatifactor muris TaxID=879566 RepID=A0A2K4ZR15_9FIRM|nr:ABC transporter ATP-binding protein [Acetatifactor muris]MCR2050956.1 ABC transporter ATP-binding protein/permease [Acetatifactor muris]SOY32931.1 putative ABC transporter ATP-binding protein [Acetatifactor muris]
MRKGKLYILKTLKLLYSSSKGMFLSIIFINMLLGILVPINLTIWRNFIDVSTVMFTHSNVGFKNSLLCLGAFVVCIVINNLLEQILDYVQNIYCSYVDYTISKKLLIKIESLSLSDMDNVEIYNYIQKAMNESFQRSISILQTLVQIVKSIFSVLGIIYTLLSFSKTVITLCILSTIPLFFLNNKILNKWYDIFNSRFEKIRFARYLKSLYIRYDNFKELKIYKAHLTLREKILDILGNNIAYDKKIRKKFMIQNVIINECDTIIIFFIKAIVVWLSYEKKQSIGSLITNMQAIDMLKNSIKNTLSMISKTYENSLYMESFFYVMEYNVEEEKRIKFNKEFKKIEFRNVWFKYPYSNKYAVRNFSYTFYKDNTYAFVGLNGSGKTTLLKLMLALYKPDRGEILVDGINLNDINKETLYDCVGAVFQDFIKYPFTVRENILISKTSTITEEQLINAAIYSEAYDFIKRLPNGFSTMLQKEWEKGTELSMGQWQKIAISRACIKDVSIMVLDEPTASIDAVAESKIFANLKKMKKNKLGILVVHRFSSIKLVDQILVMSDGELREYGTHEELIKAQGIYHELFSLQAEAYQP